MPGNAAGATALRLLRRVAVRLVLPAGAAAGIGEAHSIKLDSPSSFVSSPAALVLSTARILGDALAALASLVHRHGRELLIDRVAVVAVEYATLEWVDWFDHRRLLEPIGNIPPAEAEAAYYANLEGA